MFSFRLISVLMSSWSFSVSETQLPWNINPLKKKKVCILMPLFASVFVCTGSWNCIVKSLSRNKQNRNIIGTYFGENVFFHDSPYLCLPEVCFHYQEYNFPETAKTGFAPKFGLVFLLFIWTGSWGHVCDATIIIAKIISTPWG